MTEKHQHPLTKERCIMVQIGEAIKIKFNRFKRKYEYQIGEHGIVLERISGGICLYVTDASHDTIHCIAPLGNESDFKDTNFYLYSIDENRMFFRVRRALLYINFETKHCSSNVENFRVIGSPEWGQVCTSPWKDSYTRLYNSAEKKRNGASD
jgi:hypothetical protein